MKNGDCFYGDLRFRGNPHPWIILCDPDKDGKVAIVNCTTGRGGDKAHKLTQADCPALSHDSELAWSESVVVMVSGLEKSIAANQFSRRLAMALANVDKIVGEGLSKRLIPKEVAKQIKPL